jgi:hypothetical protein
MPIVKKEEPLKERPVIIVLWGEGGLGKTSLGNTADSPITIDFDRGIDRSINRQDTLIPTDWEEVVKEEAAGLFKKYKTVVIDTAKAALDDFLMVYVRKIDPKCRTNKLAAYGAIGDEFKLFINQRRAESADIVIIAHAKEKEDTGGSARKIPDVTGQSYQLLLRIADQVGYVSTINNKRSIQFEPTDALVGKNVARIPTAEIPDQSDPRFKTFMADLINSVRKALASQSEAQREAVALSEKYQDELAKAETPEILTQVLHNVNELPDYLKKAPPDAY